MLKIRARIPDQEKEVCSLQHIVIYLQDLYQDMSNKKCITMDIK